MLAWLALFAGGVQADPLVDRLVAQFEASPAGCTAVEPGHPKRKLIEADIASFVSVAAVPAEVSFEVRDCEFDGFVVNGTNIVVSTRLARLPPAQRFFILAHELGHQRLKHHAQMSRFVAGIVRHTPDENQAKAKILMRLAGVSHQAEFDADAFAVRLMRQAGLDPEQAALLFDSIGEGADNRTHPSSGRRARAIRAIAP